MKRIVRVTDRHCQGMQIHRKCQTFGMRFGKRFKLLIGLYIDDTCDKVVFKSVFIKNIGKTRGQHTADSELYKRPDRSLARAASAELLVGKDQPRLTEGGPVEHKTLDLVALFIISIAAEQPSLRLIEVDRDEVTALPRLFERLRGRPERFLILCDDLSFEEGAASAKALKSALEGGVGGPPENVLFTATSNRRHLMPRDHNETKGAMAAAEDAEEEVSVSDRFGLWIGFPPMDQPTYLEAVRLYAQRFDLTIKDLDRRALQWSQLRGSRSGRVAWQFIRDLAGELDRDLQG